MTNTDSDTYISGLVSRRGYLDIYFGKSRVRTGSYVVTQSLRTPCPDHTNTEAVRKWLEKIQHPELLLHETTRLEWKDPDIYATLQDGRGIVISYNDLERIERGSNMTRTSTSPSGSYTSST